MRSLCAIAARSRSRRRDRPGPASSTLTEPTPYRPRTRVRARGLEGLRAKGVAQVARREGVQLLALGAEPVFGRTRPRQARRADKPRRRGGHPAHGRDEVRRPALSRGDAAERRLAHRAPRLYVERQARMRTERLRHRARSRQGTLADHGGLRHMVRRMEAREGMPTSRRVRRSSLRRRPPRTRQALRSRAVTSLRWRAGSGRTS